MPWADLILAAIKLTTELIDRGKASGELTDEETARIQLRAEEIFERFSEAPPAPDGGI